MAALHQSTVGMADEVLLLNVGGKLDARARSMSARYAQSQGKLIRLLEDPTPRAEAPPNEQATTDTEPRVPNGDEIYLHPLDELALDEGFGDQWRDRHAVESLVDE